MRKTPDITYTTNHRRLNHQPPNNTLPRGHYYTCISSFCRGDDTTISAPTIIHLRCHTSLIVSRIMERPSDT
jgi:hypothetical protein